MPGAETEVDGSFVGSTPPTRSLTAGNHRIVVRSGGQVWERTLPIQGGDAVNVNAQLANRRAAAR